MSEDKLEVSAAQRQKLADVATVLVAHRRLVGYRQLRPMRTRDISSLAALQEMFARGERIEPDCSESVTMIFRLAGLKDPNGLSFDGWGFTGTMLSNQSLHHYTTVSDGHPGALMVFGDYPGNHVAMVLKRDGQNPLLFSHGTSAGPVAISFDDLRQGFPGQPVTMLDISELG